MCGIVGICGMEPTYSEETIIRMRDVLRHRGPDDSGIWRSSDRSVFLGHRRLSIIDLSPGGHQPMADSRGRDVVVFNGEIYNFREIRDELSSSGQEFRTQSDTEVILQAYLRWGTQCIQHFIGMFAFALYDADRDILFAARDRAGEKPFFYLHDRNSLVFASELKALMQYPGLARELDIDAMNSYLAYGYVPWDTCILRGVRKLPPGHALQYERHSNRLKTWRYWHLPEPIFAEEPDTQMLLEEYKAILTDSVRRQLDADVPVGILLSGGIDSSLITAIASQVSSKPVRTFTISFPGHSKFDEESHARLVSKHFGAIHTVLPAEANSVELLPELARQCDEPVADSSLVPTYLVSRLIRRFVRVGIGGDGGDELFGGYPHYSWLLRQDWIRRFVPPSVRSQISRFSERCLPLGFRGRNYLIGVKGSIENSLTMVNHFFSHDMRRALFLPLRTTSAHMIGQPERSRMEMIPNKGTTLQKATSLDFMTYLVDDLLVKVDRASMLASLEIRAPFLDHRLIEFAFSRVPDYLRVHGGSRKMLSCLLAKELLPKNYDFTRKHGFSIPLARWLRGEWGTYMKSVLADAGTWFERDTVMSLYRSQEQGLANTQRLFALVIAELWRREYRVALPSVSQHTIGSLT